MKAIIYLKSISVNEFDNLEDAYSFTFDNECDLVDVLGDGTYTIEEFQKAYSDNEF